MTKQGADCTANLKTRGRNCGEARKTRAKEAILGKAALCGVSGSTTAPLQAERSLDMATTRRLEELGISVRGRG